MTIQIRTTRPATPDEQARRVIPGGLQVVITPLARAALDNGVSFADVQAYCAAQLDLGTEHDQRVQAAWYEAVNVPEVWPPTEKLAATTTAMVTDTLLEGALMRSVLASGSLAAARLWWRGVL